MATNPQAAALVTALEFAIRGATVLPDGSVEIAYTRSTIPLDPGGTGAVTWGDIEVLRSAVLEFVTQIPVETLILLDLAKYWLKADGTFTNLLGPVTQANLLGNKITLNPAAPNPIRFSAIV